MGSLEKIFWDKRFPVGVILSETKKKGTSLRLAHTVCATGLIKEMGVGAPECGGCGERFTEQQGYAAELPLAPGGEIDEKVVRYWLHIWFDVEKTDIEVSIAW